MRSRSATRSRLLVFALLLLAAFAAVNLIVNLARLLLIGEPGGTEGNLDGVLVTTSMDPSTVMVLALIASLIFVSTILIAYLRYGPRRGRFPFLELIPLIVGIAIIISLAYLGQEPSGEEVDEGLGEDGGQPGEAEPGVDEPSGGTLELPPPRLLELGPALMVVALALIALTAVLLLLSLRALPPPFRRSIVPRIEREMAASLESGIYRLELGDDVKSVILSCYRDMVSLLRQRGLDARPQLTAREVEAAAMKQLGITPTSSRALREIFEVARYSSHTITEDDRGRAIDSLNMVRKELGA